MAARRPVGARWVGLTDRDIVRYLESDGDEGWAAEVGGRRTNAPRRPLRCPPCNHLQPITDLLMVI